MRLFVDNALSPDPPAELVDEIVAYRAANSAGSAPAGTRRRAPAQRTTRWRVSARSTGRRSSIHGTADNVVDAGNAPLIAEGIPGARLVLLRGRRSSSSVGAADGVHGARRGVPRVSLHTLDHWIRNSARRTPERVAIDFLGREVTYAELDRRSDALAAGSRERGLRRGDRVATLTGNSPEHVIVFFACAKAGFMLRAAQLAADGAGAPLPARRRRACGRSSSRTSTRRLPRRPDTRSSHSPRRTTSRRR